METRANFLLIGALTLAGFAGMLAFLMWFAKIELDRQFDYYDVLFPEVSGLARASQVRFAGLPVGQVLDMQLAEDGSGRVRVRLEVARDTPVRVDSRASLESQGVTGMSLVGITAGSPDAPLLDDGTGAVPVIPSAPSALQTLTDQGPEIIENLNTVAEQLTVLFGTDNQTRVANILDNIERSSASLDSALADVSAATAAISDTAGSIAGFGEHVAGLADSAQETLGKANEAIDQALALAGQAGDSFSRAVDRVDETLGTADQALGSVRSYVTDRLPGLTTQVEEAASATSGLAGRLLGSMDGLDGTIASARRTFDSASGMLDTDIGPVIGDLRTSLSGFTRAVDSVTADLPGISDSVQSAANSADAAFSSLQTMLDDAHGPVQAFIRDGLVQFTTMARESRVLVDNLNQLVTALRRNPAQIITGPQKPEFRR